MFERSGKSFTTTELGKSSDWFHSGSKSLKAPASREPVVLGGHHAYPDFDSAEGYVGWVDPDGVSHFERVTLRDLNFDYGSRLAKRLLDGGAQLPLDNAARRRYLQCLAVDLERQAGTRTQL